METERYTEEVAQLVDTGPGVVLVYEHQEDDEKWIQLAVTDRTDEAFQVNVTVGIPDGTTDDDLKETVQSIVDALAARWGGTFQAGIYADEDEEEEDEEENEEDEE
jgi:hypothetical protein